MFDRDIGFAAQHASYDPFRITDGRANEGVYSLCAKKHHDSQQ